jgi:hypothetical protein
LSHTYHVDPEPTTPRKPPALLAIPERNQLHERSIVRWRESPKMHFLQGETHCHSSKEATEHVSLDPSISVGRGYSRSPLVNVYSSGRTRKRITLVGRCGKSSQARRRRSWTHPIGSEQTQGTLFSRPCSIQSPDLAGNPGQIPQQIPARKIPGSRSSHQS